MGDRDRACAIAAWKTSQLGMETQGVSGREDYLTAGARLLGMVEEAGPACCAYRRWMVPLFSNRSLSFKSFAVRWFE